METWAETIPKEDSEQERQGVRNEDSGQEKNDSKGRLRAGTETVMRVTPVRKRGKLSKFLTTHIRRLLFADHLYPLMSYSL